MPSPSKPAQQALPACLTQTTADTFLLRIYLQPAAQSNQIIGLHGDALKIRIACPPVDGKANLAVCAFIAAQLDCRKSAIHLIRGNTSRQKTLHLQLDVKQLHTLLQLIPT